MVFILVLVEDLDNCDFVTSNHTKDGKHWHPEWQF